MVKINICVCIYAYTKVRVVLESITDTKGLNNK